MNSTSVFPSVEILIMKDPAAPSPSAVLRAKWQARVSSYFVARRDGVTLAISAVPPCVRLASAHPRSPVKVKTGAYDIDP